MRARVESIGSFGVLLLTRLSRSFFFLLLATCARLRRRDFFSHLMVQLYREGVLSLAIVIVSGVFIGMVVSLQGYNTLVKFSAHQELGQLLALSVVRELGPVITGLLFAGRAGSALTAEIGLMRATAQIRSMEVMAVDPMAHVVAPRLWAGFISVPLLTILFNVVAIMGGYLVGVHWLGVDEGAFWSNMQSAVNFRLDVLNGIIKSVVFAFVITWTALYQGYYSEPNAKGMSIATTKSVVFSSLLVLALDFVLTAIMMKGW